MITLYAPKKVGKRYLLKANVDIGADEVSLSAYLSPRTVRWAANQAKRGFDWAQSKTNEIGRALGHYIQLRGDWTPLGAIADMAASTAYRVRQHPLLQSYDDLKDGVPLYQAYSGKEGERAKQSAMHRVLMINQKAAMGDPQAYHAQTVLKGLYAADNVLKSPNRYDSIKEISHAAKHGNQSASVVLSGCKALGSCGCSCNSIQVPYDGDRLLVDPDKVDKLAGYANDILIFRGFNSNGYYPNGLSQLQEQLSALCNDPYNKGMPYYGAGYNPDDEYYGRTVVPGYGGNPDETDRRDRFWGYDFTPYYGATYQYPHGSDE